MLIFQEPIFINSGNNPGIPGLCKCNIKIPGLKTYPEITNISRDYKHIPRLQTLDLT